MAKEIVAAENSKLKKKSQFSIVMKQLAMNRGAMAGLCIFLGIVLACFVGPYFTGYDPYAMSVRNSFMNPCRQHLLGTDSLGRDLLTRLLVGGRYSLSIGLVSQFLGMFAGIVVGAIAGFFGGKVDELIMRLCDVVQAIPGMVLNMALACVFGAGFYNVIFALAFGTIAFSARMIRSSIIRIRGQEYIEAAGMINCSTTRTIVKHVMPNAISPSIVQATMGIGSKVTSAAALSYLGIGVQPPTPEWGAMLSDGRAHITTHPFLCIVPGLAVLITVLSLNLFGDGLRDALDPRLKK